MDKKNYNKPEMRVVKLRSRVPLLAGSPPEPYNPDQTARRASFSEFDGE